MYTYKIIEIKHSMWSGKPKENFEDIIHQYALDGWRFVQMAQDYGAMWYKGRINTKLIFERPVGQSHIHQGSYNDAELI